MDSSSAPLPDSKVDQGVPDLGPDSALVFLPASSYCEAAAEIFCPFYLRCGRIVGESLEECRPVFLEMCHELFEETYVTLQEAGLLQFSRAGLEACGAYLAQVECDHHLMDLVGPCQQIWVGTSPVGSPCGLDLESFICDEEATCALDLSLCGECVAAAATGATCGEGVQCRHPDKCVKGSCAAPAFPGEACGDQRGCITGASCQAGSCVARRFVGLGEACDNEHRCPYRGSCVGGICVKSSMLGEACGDTVICAAGFCDRETLRCVPLLAPGQPCMDRAECRSRRCGGGMCDNLVSPCLE